MLIATPKHFIGLLAVCLLVTTGCAPQGPAAAAKKIGMHIDAVLEFVIEYPLDWSKSRRLTYGSKDGEVRWSHRKHPEALLQVVSKAQQPHTPDIAQGIEALFPEYPGLVVNLEEEVELSASTAWHILAHTDDKDIEAFIYTTPDRSYRVTLSVPLDTLSDYTEIMTRASESFAPMPRQK